MGRRYFHGRAFLALVMGGLILPVCNGQEAKGQEAKGKGQETSGRQEVLKLNDYTGRDIIKTIPATLPADAKGTAKLLADALAIVKEKNQPLNYNALIILGLVATQAKDFAAAEVFFRAAIDRAAKLDSEKWLRESYGGLINAFFDGKKYAEAGRVCEELISLSAKAAEDNRIFKNGDSKRDPFFNPYKPLVPGARRNLVQALSKQKKYDEALKMVDELLKDNNHWLELELKGRVLHDAGRDEEAIKVFENIIDQVGKDKTLKDDEREDFLEHYRYSLSSLYIDLNKIDEAAGLLEKLIEASPKNPSYYNDLGYIWADKNIRLKEAEKMIRKALELDRQLRKAIGEPADQDKGAYLDSLGWVLFRQKSYREAKEAFLKAVEDKSAQHIEIYDHLGDTCHALGDIEAAREAWMKGLKSATDSRRDQLIKKSVEKKLEQNK